MRAGTIRSTSLAAAAVVVLAAVGVAVWAAGALALRAREMAAVALAAGLGRGVTVGWIHGDPWRGVVLEDVSVPGAALEDASVSDAAPSARPMLTVRRATLVFDPRTLARDLLLRQGITRSITQVILDEPDLVVERDRAGIWNIRAALQRLAGRPGDPGFTGRLIVLDGTVTLLDRQRIAPEAFAVRFAAVAGSADFARAPRIAIGATFVEERGAQRATGTVRGTYSAATHTLDLDLAAADGDAAAWGRYLIPGPGIRITGGRFDAALHLLRAPAGGREVTDFTGRITVRDGRAVVPSRRAAVSAVQGEIEVHSRWLRTSRLRGVLNGAPLEVRGEASFNGEPYLDLAVRAPVVDLTALRNLLYPRSAHRLAGTASGELRLAGPYRALRVDGRLKVARGRVDAQPFANATADLALEDRRLSLTNVRGEAAGGRLLGSAWWTLGAPEFFLTLRVEGADAAAARRWVPAGWDAGLRGGLDGLRGRLDGSLLALGQEDGLTVAGRATLAGPVIGAVALDTLDASFRSDAGGVAVEHLVARQGPAWAAAHGRLRPGGALALEASVGALDLARLPDPRALRTLAGRAEFIGAVRGSLAAPELTGVIQVAQGRFGDLAFDTVHGRVVLTSGDLRLDGLILRAARAYYRAAGSLAWRPAPRVALDVEVDHAPAEVLAAAAGLSFPVQGLVDGRIRIEGPTGRPTVAGTAALRDAEVQGQAVDHAAAAFRWDGSRLAVEGGVLRRRESELRFAGAFDRRTGLALDVGSRGLDLRDLALPPQAAAHLEGRVAVSGRITGPPAAPTLAASLASSSLILNGMRFDQASGEIQWQSQIVRLQPLLLRADGEQYEIAGEVRYAGTPGATLAATVTGGRLSTLLGLANLRLDVPLDGTVSGTAEVDGPLANPTARLDLRLAEGRFGSHPIVGGHADLTLRDGSITIQDLELRPARGQIAATGRLNLRGENQIEVSGTDLDLDFLRPAFRLRRPLVGRLDFTTQFGGTLAVPEIGFALEIARGGFEGATFDSLVANAYYREGLLQLQQALLVQGGHKLRVSGSLPFNPAQWRFDDSRPLDLRLSLADVNLGLLRLATEIVEEGTGAVEGEVRVSGTAAAPRLAGGVQVRDGRLRLRGLQSPIEALRLALRFDGSAVRVEEGTARLGGGTARLEGVVRIVELSTPHLVLAASEEAPLLLHASDARIVVAPYVDARASGTVRLWGTLGDARRPPTVEGRIAVSDGTVNLIPAAGRPPAPRPPLVFRGVQLDTGRNLAVRAGGLRFELRPEGSLILTGSWRAPVLEGSVEAQQGAVTALGTVFDLREGTATFQPHLGLRPLVAARAETQVGATRISLGIRGTAPDALALDLHSDPELPRAEILSLLGRQASLTRLLTGDVEGALRAEIGRLLFGQVSLAIGRAVGLSELVIEYDFERPMLLRAGKLLLPGLYLTAETTFAERARWLWALEYRFARGWQLALRMDSAGRRDAIVWYTTRY